MISGGSAVTDLYKRAVLQALGLTSGDWLRTMSPVMRFVLATIAMRSTR
jgi:hypothetical protein